MDTSRIDSRIKIYLEIEKNKFEEIEIDPETFVIDEHNVEGELCGVGRNLCFYGNLAADLKAQAARKKGDLEKFMAEEAINIRTDAQKNGKKITESGVKEHIITKSQYSVLVREIQEAERDFVKIDNLFKAQNKKADCIIALAYKNRAELKGY